MDHFLGGEIKYMPMVVPANQLLITYNHELGSL